MTSLGHPWYNLLRRAVEEHTVETGGGKVPVDNVVEWLAEWGREIHRRQRGLLLLTGHRATLELAVVEYLEETPGTGRPNGDTTWPHNLRPTPDAHI